MAVLTTQFRCQVHRIISDRAIHCVFFVARWHCEGMPQLEAGLRHVLGYIRMVGHQKIIVTAISNTVSLRNHLESPQWCEALSSKIWECRHRGSRTSLRPCVQNLEIFDFRSTFDRKSSKIATRVITSTKLAPGSTIRCIFFVTPWPCQGMPLRHLGPTFEKRPE